MRLATRCPTMEKYAVEIAPRQRTGRTSRVAAASHRRGGGRKRIVAPDGSEIAPAPKPQADGALIKALARARRWQRLLEIRVYTSVTEIAEVERIGKSYVSRILRLALLAPDIVDAIVAGRTNQDMILEQLERPLPADWSEQRDRLFSSGIPRLFPEGLGRRAKASAYFSPVLRRAFLSGPVGTTSGR